MKPRPIKELLILLRDELPNFIIKERCLCWTIATMTHSCITRQEAEYLNDYIEKHRPLNSEGYAFWWPMGELAPRMKFLNKLIANYEKD